MTVDDYTTNPNLSEEAILKVFWEHKLHELHKLTQLKIGGAKFLSANYQQDSFFEKYFCANLCNSCNLCSHFSFR